LREPLEKGDCPFDQETERQRQQRLDATREMTGAQPIAGNEVEEPHGFPFIAKREWKLLRRMELVNRNHRGWRPLHTITHSGLSSVVDFMRPEFGVARDLKPMPLVPITPQECRHGYSTFLESADLSAVAHVGRERRECVNDLSAKHCHRLHDAAQPRVM
jgi:hypothetical protein